jgi:hypothetical protein
MKFSPPTIGARRAIGPLERLPGNVRNAFLPHRDFEPTPTPDPSDWLLSTLSMDRRLRTSSDPSPRNPVQFEIRYTFSRWKILKQRVRPPLTSWCDLRPLSFLCR